MRHNTRLLTTMNEAPMETDGLETTMMHHLYNPSIHSLQHGRKLLLDRESELSWDHNAKSSASEVELRANRIFQTMREHERRTLFGDLPGKVSPGLTSRDMGGRFLVNKDRVEASRTYEIAKKMPKGCHLHVHLNSDLPADLLLRNIRKLPETVFVKTSRRLVDLEDFKNAELVFKVLPKDHAQENIFSCEYEPKNEDGQDGWMKWNTFCQSFFMNDVAPKTLPDKSCLNFAEVWALSKLTFDVKTAYGSTQTLNGVWAHYNRCTRAVKGLIGAESLYRWYVQESIERMVEEKVYYAEWRPMLMEYTIATDDGQRQLDASEQMNIIEKVVLDMKKKWKDRFMFGIKIIYCVPRSIPHATMWLELMNCIRLKQKHANLICGFDLVGAEDRPYNIEHYADLLFAFQKTCADLGLDIPFLFHAGETNIDTGGTHSSEHSNIYDALLLRTKRLGHGISLAKHPLLAEEYKKRGIALEICPISNELLHLCINAKEHRLSDLLALGLHCTINSDNCTIFRSTLSHNFYQVMVGSVSMTLSGCRQLVLWSIEHSCLNEQDKAAATAMLNTDWNVFTRWVVEEYASYAESIRYPHYL